MEKMVPINFCCLSLLNKNHDQKIIGNSWVKDSPRFTDAVRKSSASTMTITSGRFEQYNHPNSNWINFFIEQRLDVQVKLAIKSGAVDAGWEKKFEALYAKLPSLIAVEKPSLIHGDLWSGNLITDEKGEPCLIDPAVYYGNREADLAMTRLFGGFSGEFYSAYEEAFPLPPGAEGRVDLYNLYPLLVHVNLFGGSYVHSVESILRAFS